MNRVNFELLDNAVKKMGATPDKAPINLAPIEKEKILIEKLSRGITVERQDFDNIREIGSLFATDEGLHAFLYIDKPRASNAELRKTPAPNPKFHLIKCKHLIEAHEKQRSHRYKLINNEDGTFPCHPFDYKDQRSIETETINAKLQPCYSCLIFLGIRIEPGPAARKLWYNTEYNFQKLRQHYQPFFFDQRYHGGSEKVGIENITFREKFLRKADYTCHKVISPKTEEEVGCGVKLDERTDLLHLHHWNGHVSDLDRSNLHILCKQCHCFQTDNEHITIEEMDYISEQLDKMGANKSLLDKN